MKVSKVHKDAKLPVRAHKADAGLDLYALEDVFIDDGNVHKVKTGISCAIPEGNVGLILEKSGLAVKGLGVSGGVIDSSYRGEIQVLLHKINSGDKAFQIEKGQKIAQLVIVPILTPELELVHTLDETERGSGGFGSTGLN